MNTHYFTNCGNIDELKSLFRRLCIKLHPDTGGNANEFIAMHAEYESILKSRKFQLKNEYEEKAEYSFVEYFRPVLDKIIHLQDIHIEIIGTWIWVSGDTFDKREYFKECGFLFSGKKKAWFYNGSTKKCRTYKNYTIEDLRSKWGYEEVESNPAQQVA